MSEKIAQINRKESLSFLYKIFEEVRKVFIKYFHAVSNGEYHNKTTGFRSYFWNFHNGARLKIMKKPVIEDSEKTLTHRLYLHCI